MNNFLDVPGAGAEPQPARPHGPATRRPIFSSKAAGAHAVQLLRAAARPGGVGAGVERPGAAAAAAARPGGVGAGVERPGAAAAAAARPGGVGAGVERPCRSRCCRRASWHGQSPVRIWRRTDLAGSRIATSGKATAMQRHDEIRNQYEQNNPGNFWQENPGWAALAITRPFAWATWGSVGSWCGYSEEAMPYSYGENVYYADDQVYYGDQPVATTDEYAEQAAAIATTAPTAAPEKGEWLPLGVFALTQDGQASGAEPTLYMQLAISKQAAIAGTLKNTPTGKVGHAGRNGRQEDPAGRLDHRRPAAPRHGDGPVQPDPRHLAGPDPFCRRPDAAMADGAAAGTDADAKAVAGEVAIARPY